jgi:hypothetical protein
MKTIDTTKVSVGKKRKLIVTPEEMLSEVLIKIERALNEYESAEIDKIDIDLEVGVNYAEKSWEELRHLHEKLTRNMNGVDYIKLLIIR